MAAGVHGVNRVAQVVGHLFFAGVRQAGFLLHRQAVHVGTDEQCRSVAVLEYADKAVAADTGGDLQPCRAEFSGQTLGRLDLHERQLRIGMKMFVQRNERRQLVINGCGNAVFDRISRLNKRQAETKRDNARNYSGFHRQIERQKHPTYCLARQG